MTAPARQRICFVVASPLTATAFLTEHVSALSATYDVHLVVNADPATIVDAKLRKATVHRARIERPIAPWADIRALFQLIGILRRGRYAAVHSLTPKAGLLASIAGFAVRVPVRMHTFTGQVWATRRGPGRWLFKVLDTVIARLDTHVLADSVSQRDFLRAQGVLGAQSGEVLGNGSVSGVDAGRFRPDPVLRSAVRAELAIPEDAIIFLFVGRLTRDKGVAELGAAFAEAAVQRHDVYLLMVGPDEEALYEDVRRACGNHAPRVRFTGFSSRPERFMAAADVFCLPSRREGFGSVVIEAAAAGVPAIASGIYGVVDAVEDGITGLLVAPGDTAALADAMLRLARDPGIRRSMGAAARERALRDYSHEKVTSALVAFYARVLAAPAAPGEPASRRRFD